MCNTLISTFSSSIGVIQLKLSDFDQAQIDFEKIIDERFQNLETPRNVNQKLELLENNHMDYINPICPHYNSKKINKQEYRERKLKIDNSDPMVLYLRRYLCKSCNKKFTTSLNSIIKPEHRYPSLFMDRLIDLIQTGYRSLRNIAEDFLNFFSVKISHQTIHNWLQKTTKSQIKNIKTCYSGYYCYDEQYVKINGTWMYRLTLYDHILNIPVTKKIAPDKEYTIIKHFIQESTENKPLIAITTDHVPEYKTIMDELGVKHQLCIFHFYKMIGDKLYKLLRSKKTSEDEKTRLKKYFKEIRQIFDTKNYETASNLLEELLSHFDNIPHVLQRFITKKILPNLNRLTQFMHDPKISRTSNHVENYYRQTLPRANKKKYKTIHGLINYLKLKIQKWTSKHGKHHQHQTT
jgi:transposase-like protein